MKCLIKHFLIEDEYEIVENKGRGDRHYTSSIVEYWFLHIPDIEAFCFLRPFEASDSNHRSELPPV
jgi:hypothetical protein